MLNAIIKAALKHRLLTLGLALAALGLGLGVLINMRVDVFPDLNRPSVTILTEGHGLAPEEVESLVSFPIESALNGTPGLIRLRSQSGIGLSVVWAEFDFGTDIWRVRQLIAERLANAKDRLPKGVEPAMAPVSSIMGEIFWVGLKAKPGLPSEQVATPMEQRTYGEWTLRPRLLAIPGVSQVVVMGGGLKQVQIQLLPKEVNRRQLNWSELRDRLLDLGDNTAGGFLDKDGQEYLVRNLARPADLDDLKNSVVGTWLGNSVRLRDIARVEYGPAPARGKAGINGEEGVIVTIFKSPDADTLALTRAIEKALKEMAPTVPAGMELKQDLFKQATFIEAAIHNVSKSLYEGAFLVLVILLIFLGSFRVSVITLTAIPLSFMATVLVMSALGLSVNTMTLGGLAIACGELVDDAIVDVENIFRRLKEARAKGVNGLDLLEVIFHASVEVRSSIVIATAIVILAFLPMLALGGMEGRLFVPLGVAYMVSILCSLLVSLTVTPVLASFLLTHAKDTAEARDSWIMVRLKRFQEGNLKHALRRPKLILVVCGVLIVGAMVGFVMKGKEFLPPFNESTSTILFSVAPGISLDESNDLGSRVEKAILSIPGVASTNRRTGRAEGDEHAEGVNKSEIDVSYKADSRPRPVVVKEIEDRLKKDFPMGSVSIGAPISHRIDHMLSGVEAAVAIKIFGDDLAGLRLASREVVKALKGTPGLVDLTAEQQVLIPQVKIQLDRDKLAAAKLSAGQTAETLEMAFAGSNVGSLIEGQQRVDIVARLAPEERKDIDAMGRARLATLPDGSWVTVGDVADVYETDGPNQVLRENMGRRMVVSANVRGRSMSETIQEVDQRLKTVTLPQGYRVVVGGQYESQQAGQKRIVVLGFFSMLAVFLLLLSHYDSWLIALQIMANIPLALVGSVAALYIVGGNVSLASIVAFITLCGIASRNGILMISHYLHLIENEGEKFDEHMIIRGSLERLGPVLMTALTALLALVPFLMEPHAPGREILYPVAVVIVGGLISSTLLDLFVTPVLFSLTGRTLLGSGHIKVQGGNHEEKPVTRRVQPAKRRALRSRGA